MVTHNGGAAQSGPSWTDEHEIHWKGGKKQSYDSAKPKNIDQHGKLRLFEAGQALPSDWLMSFSCWRMYNIK